jgi:hypothetical protein
MSQKAGLGVHKIEARGHFEYHGFKIVFGRDLNGKVHILNYRWQNVLGEQLSVEQAIESVNRYHQEQIALDSME